ncbi:MAG: ATP-dependent DNA ligase [Candidatus Bathyarchaeia archaeon]
MRYSELVEVYEEIGSTSKRLEMTDLLVDLLKKAPRASIDKVIYLTQGKLYPDFMGVEIGVAEKLVIKSIGSVSGRPESEIEKALRKTGDLGEAAEEFLQRKSQTALLHRPLTVETVYESFEKMAKATGSGSVDTKIRYLNRLLSDATPLEAKYLVRTALGRLRLGVADMTILDALAIAFGGGKEAREVVERAYNLSSDLGHVARTIAEKGLESLASFQVRVGRPIRPMLAERLSDPGEIIEKLGGRCAAEYKYDGIRVQAHIAPSQVMLFSRRLENITSQFPDVVKILSQSVTSRDCIVEGECVAFNPDTGDMQPFQAISQRRGRKYEIEEIEKEVPVKIFLFDLLYADGVDYTQTPYPERRAALQSIVREGDLVAVSQQIVTGDPAELDRYMDQAISEGCEGIVVKSLDQSSIYKAGARGWTWIKYKRSYKAEIVDTFDLVPVGAFSGRGKRAGSYGALLMAAYNRDADTFETVCKLGSGFTDADLASLPERLRDSTLQQKHARVSSLMEPDIWLSPSTVLEVAADEITLSPLHTCGKDVVRKDTGFALRFPRFTGNYRYDKAPEDATTTAEIIEVYRSQLKQITSQDKAPHDLPLDS